MNKQARAIEFTILTNAREMGKTLRKVLQEVTQEEAVQDALRVSLALTVIDDLNNTLNELHTAMKENTQ